MVDFEWDPNDPVLTKLAPYELPGVARWHLAKVPPRQIMKLLKMGGQQLVKELNVAQQKADQAIRKGIPVHAELFKGDIDG